MRRLVVTILILCVLTTAGTAFIKNRYKVVSKGLKHCEGTVVYNDKLFVSNFGTEELDSLNNENNGYVLSFDKNMKSEMLISSGRGLSAPKGMAVLNNHLYIADVGRVMIFNLEDLEMTPVTLRLSEKDVFVNDIVAIGDEVWFSVTDSGNIYKYQWGGVPKKVLSIEGANGLFYDGQQLYVASYSDNGKVYVIKDVKNPVPEIFFDVKASYDGVTVDSETLYLTSWGENQEPRIFAVNKEDPSDYKILKTPTEIKGPADISYFRGRLWIPDLIQSKLVGIKIFH